MGADFERSWMASPPQASSAEPMATGWYIPKSSSYGESHGRPRRYLRDLHLIRA